MTSAPSQVTQTLPKKPTTPASVAHTIDRGPSHRGTAHEDPIWDKMFHSALTLSSVAVFYAVAGTRVDLLLNVALLAYFNRQALASHLHTTIVSVPILLLFCLGVTLAVLVMLASPSSHASTWQGPGQPYLIPCRTTHRRFSPKKHSFSYSYLTVGVPVGFNGSFNGMIGVYEKPSSPFRNTVSFMKPFFQSWYHIQASDYLQRGGDELGLRGKLNSYLQSEVQFPLSRNCSMLT